MERRLFAITIILIIILILSTPLAFAEELNLSLEEILKDFNSIVLVSEVESGRISMANSSASEYYGYSPEELERMTLDDLAMDDRGFHLDKILAMNYQPLRFIHKNHRGEELNVQVKGYMAEMGGKEYSILRVEDISHLLQIEKGEARAKRSIYLLTGLLFFTSIFLLRSFSKERKQNKDIINRTELLKTFLDANIDETFIKNSDYKYIFFNESFKKNNPMPADQMLNKGDFEIYSEEQANLYRNEDLKALEDGKVIFLEDEDGKIKRTTKFPVKLANGEYGIGGYIEDITEEHRNREVLNRLNESLNYERDRLRLILDSVNEGIFGLDNEGSISFINNSALKMLGYSSANDLLGKHIMTLTFAQEGRTSSLEDEGRRTGEALAKGEKIISDKEIFWKADGTSFPVEYFACPQFDGKKFVGSVVTFTDITDRKKAEREIEELSFHDALTGLYNRRFFETELKRLDVRRNLPISIIVGDVNGLKLINDIFGHNLGDELLIKSAMAIREACREDDIIARYGGDEFAILLTNTGKKETRTIIERIKGKLLEKEVADLEVSVSFGCATKENEDVDISEILLAAEEKMYVFKTAETKDMSKKFVDNILDRVRAKSIQGYEYSLRVAKLSEKMAHELDIVGDGVDHLRMTGLYQDIGKIIFSKDIIEEVKALTEKERENLKKHTEVGYRILNFSTETSPIAKYVLHHHENWDGTGFPNGLKGEEIPLFSRVTAITGDYERFVCKLPYGRGMTREEGIREVERQAGYRFDPNLAKIFIRMMEREED